MTLADSLASATVPEDILEPFSDVRPEPLPVKELLALEKVLAPVKVCPAPSRATLADSLPSLMVPEDMLDPFRLVRLTPDRTGSNPPPVVWTN